MLCSCCWLSPQAMKQYTPMHPLWYLRTKVRVSDRYPSGLEWVSDDRYHKEGDMAGTWKQALGRYMICVGGERYHAHRLVYYLRTGVDPGQNMVLHNKDNPGRDNRQELVLQERKETKQKNSYNVQRSFAGQYW